jgi:hypothetical protein
MKALAALTLTIGRFNSSSAFPAYRAKRVAPISKNHFQNSFSLSSSTTILSMTTSSSAKRVLVPIADDSEEIETTCITDTLTRFGAEVVVASVKPGGQLLCKMSRGVKVGEILCLGSGSFHPN